METAGLPTDNLLITRTSLPEPVQQLHRRTLHTLAQTGTPPTRGELEAWGHDLRLNLDAALHQLAEAELMFVDPSGREITGGVPFAAGPTAHRVRIFDGPTVFANCAVDALGIAAMLDRAVDVVSLDPQTGEQVTATGFGLSSGTRRRRRAMLRSQDFAQGRGEGMRASPEMGVINIDAACALSAPRWRTPASRALGNAPAATEGPA